MCVGYQRESAEKLRKLIKKQTKFLVTHSIKYMQLRVSLYTNNQL